MVLLWAQQLHYLEQTLGAYTENWQFWLGLILILEILYVRSGILGLFDKKIMNNKILNIKNYQNLMGHLRLQIRLPLI